MFKRYSTTIKRIIIASVVAASIATTGGSIGRTYWLLDLASHFHMQYLLVLILSSIILISYRKYLWASVAIIFMVFNIALVSPFLLSHKTIARDTEKTAPIRVLFANTLYTNKEIAQIKQLVKNENPDILVLAETSQTFVDYLLDSSPEYVSHTFRDGRGVFGIALLSKFPETKPVKALYVENQEIAALIGTFSFQGTAITMVGAHPYPPISPNGATMRNTYLEMLGKNIENITTPLILVGDLNSTSWSPYFQDLKNSANLKDTREGFGIQPSWPTAAPYILRIPIDHILVSQNINVINRRLGTNINSDHLPVIADLSIPITS